MKRIIIVYNPRSSKAKLVEREVFEVVRKVSGVIVGKYEILPSGVEENIKKLAKILDENDLVVAAGGDATALIALNGCMKSGKKVIFSALSLGNFNDTAATLGDLEFSEVVQKFLDQETKEFYPLKILIDGEEFRYAAGYVTVGMFAKATEIFDEKKNRRELQKGKRKSYSYLKLAGWYFKHRKEEFLSEELTDYVAFNGRKMAGIMRGKDWFLGSRFLFFKGDLSGILRLGKFMAKSILSRVPGEEVLRKEIDFEEKSEIMVQTEGEAKKIKCQKIEIIKDEGIRAIIK